MRCPTRHRYRAGFNLNVIASSAGTVPLMSLVLTRVRFFERFFLAFPIVSNWLKDLNLLILILWWRSVLNWVCEFCETKAQRYRRYSFQRSVVSNPSRKRLNDFGIGAECLRSTGGYARLLSKTSVIVVINVYDHSRGGRVQLSRIRTPWSGLPV